MNLFASFKQETLLNWMPSHRRIRYASVELSADGRYLGCLEDKANTGQYDAQKDTNDEVIFSHGNDDDKDL